MTSRSANYRFNFSKIYLSDLYCSVFAIFIFVSMSPFYVWGYYELSYFLFFAAAFFLLIVKLGFDGAPVKFYFFSFIVFLLSFYYYLLSGSSIVSAMAFSASISILFLMRQKELVSLFIKFKILYSLLLFPAIIIWIAHHALGDFYLFSLGKVESGIIPNQLKVDAGQGYMKYPFMVVLDYMLNSPLYRFSGPFDEPGVIGTISSLLLVADRFDLKSNQNRLILISGILSLSLAFLVITIVYALMTVFRNRASFFYVSLILSVGLFVWFFFEGEYVAQRTISRVFSFDDNRLTSDFSFVLESWYKGGLRVLLFGLPSYENSGSSSWLIILVRSGIVGLLILSFILLIAMFRWSRRFSLDVFIFVFIFVLSIYQRPDILKPVFIMMLMFVVSKDFMSRKIIIRRQ